MWYLTGHVMSKPAETKKVAHKSVYVRLSAEEVEALQRVARSEERTISAQIRYLVKQGLEGREDGWRG